MHNFLAEDHAQLDKILENVLSEANHFLSEVDTLSRWHSFTIKDRRDKYLR